MQDYYIKVHGMKEEPLVAEIERMNRLLWKTAPGTPMYNQLLGMLNTAQGALDELMFKQRVKKEDKIIEIGHVDSTTTIPDYDSNALLTAIVQEYRKGFS
jgi:hypothetical protein